MTTSTIWTPIDLKDKVSRRDAILFAREVMEKAGDSHLRHDLEWALCGDTDNPPVVAFGANQGDGVLGFALLLRQARPLRFQLGELTYYRRNLTRYDLWSGPVIAGVSDQSDHWRELARTFLSTAKAHIAPAFEVIGIEGMPIQGPFHQLLLNDPGIKKDYLLINQGESFEHQFIDMPSTFDAYVEQLGKRSKKSLAYSQRRLLRDFADDIEITCFEHECDVQSFVDHATVISEKTYQWHLLGQGLRNRTTFEKRVHFAAEKGWLRSYIMFCSGRPVAFMLGYQYQGCFYYTDVGFDPEYGKWSVGSVLQLEVLEDLYARSDQPSIFDFSTGYGDHKARFGNRQQNEINLLLLPRTLRHAVLASAYKRLDGLANLAVSTADRIGVKRVLKKTFRKIATSTTDNAQP